MKEVFGNIWDYYNKDCWIVITTNGSIKTDGTAVMGRGIALQAKRRFPELPLALGQSIKENGNVLVQCAIYRLIFFPVKHKWQEKADIKLIEESARELKESLDHTEDAPEHIYMGGNGGLDWKDVKPILEKCLDDRFVIVERG